MRDKSVFSSRDIKMLASKLRPAFVLSTTQEFVSRTHDCDFYGGKMFGKNSDT